LEISLGTAIIGHNVGLANLRASSNNQRTALQKKLQLTCFGFEVERFRLECSQTHGFWPFALSPTFSSEAGEPGLNYRNAVCANACPDSPSSNSVD
jgi:hypothetical protein